MQSGPLLGFHVSIAEGIDQSVDRALAIGCTTFQVFTRNPRGWAFKPLGDEEASLFREKRKKAGYRRVVAHMPYLPNLATSIKAFQKKSRASLTEEVARCSKLEIDYVVAHIGSHMGKGTMEGVRNVAAACNEALEATPGGTTLLVETMAGQKHSVGSRFEGGEGLAFQPVVFAHLADGAERFVVIGGNAQRRAQFFVEAAHLL